MECSICGNDKTPNDVCLSCDLPYWGQVLTYRQWLERMESRFPGGVDIDPRARYNSGISVDEMVAELEESALGQHTMRL